MNLPTIFAPDRHFQMRDQPNAEFDDFGIRGTGYGARVTFGDGSSGTVYWNHEGKNINGVESFDLVNVPEPVPRAPHAPDIDTLTKEVTRLKAYLAMATASLKNARAHNAQLRSAIVTARSTLVNAL
jgi:hypothetical protein